MVASLPVLRDSPALIISTSASSSSSYTTYCSTSSCWWVDRVMEGTTVREGHGLYKLKKTGVIFNINLFSYSYLGSRSGIARHGGRCWWQTGQLLNLGDRREWQPPCSQTAGLLLHRRLLSHLGHVLRGPGLAQSPQVSGPRETHGEAGGSPENVLLTLRPFKEEMLDFIQGIRSVLLRGIHW